MLTPDLLTSDQEAAITRLYQTDATLLHAQMGSGKTCVILSAIKELLRDGVLNKVLIVAPLRVANTVWKQESEAWSHLAGMKIVVCTGSLSARTIAVSQPHDVLVVNFEGLPWLAREVRMMPSYDGLVIDELSRMKVAGGVQFKALRPHLKGFAWRVGATGTPASEDFLGLYAQCLVLDSGAALGTRADGFRRRFFYQTDYQGYRWELKPGADAQIAERISGLVWSVPDYRDSLPSLEMSVVDLVMPDSVRDVYDSMRKDMVVDLDDGEIVAANSAVLVGKLQQVCNGFLYADDGVGGRETVWLSDYRVRACVKAVHGCDGPVMLVVWYSADRERLLEALPEAVELGSDSETVVRWNRGEIPCLVTHPRSVGHGLNLARGGRSMVWFSGCFSADLRSQTIARLWRRGQTRTVRVIDLCVAESVDGIVRDRVMEKGIWADTFKAHLGG